MWKMSSIYIMCIYRSCTYMEVIFRICMLLYVCVCAYTKYVHIRKSSSILAELLYMHIDMEACIYEIWLPYLYRYHIQCMDLCVYIEVNFHKCTCISACVISVYTCFHIYVHIQKLCIHISHLSYMYISISMCIRRKYAYTEVTHIQNSYSIDTHFHIYVHIQNFHIYINHVFIYAQFFYMHIYMEAMTSLYAQFLYMHIDMEACIYGR